MYHFTPTDCSLVKINLSACATFTLVYSIPSAVTAFSFVACLLMYHLRQTQLAQREM